MEGRFYVIADGVSTWRLFFIVQTITMPAMAFYSRQILKASDYSHVMRVTLDPVYTGRAAGGLIDLIRKGFFKPNEKVLFWHTGGAPALFAEPYQTALLA